MTAPDTPRKIVDALWERPALLLAVLQLILMRPWVMRPWQSRGRTRGRKREDALGHGTALVFPSGVAQPDEPHNWMVRSTKGEIRKEGHAPTEAEAIQAVDEFLRAQGCLLVDRGKP